MQVSSSIFVIAEDPTGVTEVTHRGWDMLHLNPGMGPIQTSSLLSYVAVTECTLSKCIRFNL